MQIIDEARTTRQLPFDKLIAALEAMFIEGCCVPLRHTHAIEGAPGDTGTLLVMPAWQPGKRLGVKTVSIFPGNKAKALPGLHSTFVLFDAGTGRPLAMLDGDTITSRRTAAASALASKYLSRPDARTLVVLGAGRVASLLPEAHRTVRPIETVKIWDIDSQAAQRLVGRLREQGMAAEHAVDIEPAVRSADIVSCATLSQRPLVQGAWLQPGAHLDLIGSFTPAMRESDDECFRRATVFVDTEEALAKSGDILEALRSGAFEHARVAAMLDALCRGQHGGRTHAGEITLFKAVGTALEDLAAASLAYDA